MQSEDDWDDDWDDDVPDSPIPSVLFTNMRIAIGVSLVILLLLSSMIFTNFGLYYGAGSLSVLIDVNEGRDTSDKNFDFSILATSPAFGMLAKEGSYKVLVSPSSINHTGGSVTVTSGTFTFNGEGRGSVTMLYSDVFTVNGNYTVQVECGSQKATDTVTLNKFAETAIAELPLFNGEKPLDKDEGIVVNLQFLTELVGATEEAPGEGLDGRTTVIPWATGTITLYHSEEIFDSGKGHDYWNTDGSREPEPAEVIDFVHTGDVMIFTYESGTVDNQLPFILDTSEFYDGPGSGDYAMIIEFTNDLGSDNSLKTGQSFWKWFHVCEVKNSECDGDN